MIALFLIDYISYYLYRSDKTSIDEEIRLSLCIFYFVSLALVFYLTLRKLLKELKQIDPVN